MSTATAPARRAADATRAGRGITTGRECTGAAGGWGWTAAHVAQHPAAVARLACGHVRIRWPRPSSRHHTRRDHRARFRRHPGRTGAWDAGRGRHLRHGAGADVVSKKGNTVFSLYFSANNLLNTAYQNHLSRIRYAPENIATGRVGVFNMGRNFSIKLVIPLGIKK